MGYHAWTRKYDDDGRETEAAFFGLQREPVLLSDGYHKKTVQYDAGGRETVKAYFGVDNNPILFASGFARETFLYDEKGNRKQFSYFGVDNKPIRCRDGFAKLVWTRKEGVEVELAAFDEKDKPLPLCSRIDSVKAGGLGQRGGLKVGDVIVNYNGNKVEDYLQFFRLCKAARPAGTAQKLTILRSGRMISLTIPSGDLALTLKPVVLPSPAPGDPAKSAKDRSGSVPYPPPTEPRP